MHQGTCDSASHKQSSSLSLHDSILYPRGETPKIPVFPAEVCHVREAVAVSSGTVALHLALLAHGIGPGDEVITTAFSKEDRNFGVVVAASIDRRKEKFYYIV